jgi:hypothetical protein
MFHGEHRCSTPRKGEGRARTGRLGEGFSLILGVAERVRRGERVKIFRAILQLLSRESEAQVYAELS